MIRKEERSHTPTAVDGAFFMMRKRLVGMIAVYFPVVRRLLLFLFFAEHNLDSTPNARHLSFLTLQR